MGQGRNQPSADFGKSLPQPKAGVTVRNTLCSVGVTPMLKEGGRLSLFTGRWPATGDLESW
jgi:hypothetical protein